MHAVGTDELHADEQIPTGTVAQAKRAGLAGSQHAADRWRLRYPPRVRGADRPGRAPPAGPVAECRRGPWQPGRLVHARSHRPVAGYPAQVHCGERPPQCALVPAPWICTVCPVAAASRSTSATPAGSPGRTTGAATTLTIGRCSSQAGAQHKDPQPRSPYRCRLGKVRPRGRPGSGRLAAESGRGKDLARVGQPGRIERTPQELHRGQVVVGEHARQLRRLVHPDTMLAGNRAATGHAQVEDRAGDLLRRVELARARSRRRAPADAGCRRRRGTRWPPGCRPQSRVTRSRRAPRPARCAGSRHPGRCSCD